MSRRNIVFFEYFVQIYLISQYSDPETHIWVYSLFHFIIYLQ
jgi:hypothetical protein